MIDILIYGCFLYLCSSIDHLWFKLGYARLVQAEGRSPAAVLVATHFIIHASIRVYGHGWMGCAAACGNRLALITMWQLLRFRCLIPVANAG